MAVLLISNLTYFLISFILFVIGIIKCTKFRGHGEAPGPFRWPIIGNLHLLRNYKIPYQGFTDLAKKFGDVYSLQMGSVPAVVVHGVDNIRHVLVQKGHHFDSRPNFDRYHQLFHGNKQNSLAFCDWSDVQKKRRDLLKDHTFPKVYSNNFQHLNKLVCDEIKILIEEIKDTANNNITSNNRNVINVSRPKKPSLISKKIRKLMANKHVETIIRFPSYLKFPQLEPQPKMLVSPHSPVDIKEKLLLASGNIFLNYFCSTRFENDPEFARFVRNFDEIFYEVNQGYAYDFLPMLSIFFQSDIKKVQKCSEDIREFVLNKIIKNRLEEIEEGTEEKDYVDTLLKNVKFGEDVRLDLETALFSLEDIIGGHSAIANFLVKLLTFVVDNKIVQRKIKEEVDQRKKEFITLDDRCYMPYTEAVVLESLRLLSSPIVPHVANQDTTISGYNVKKDTLVFLNNYELNMSETLWTNPHQFDPSRFINPETGAKTKPAHFLPFGGGKRSCMGYKLVQFLSFVFVANVVNNFQIVSVPGEKYDEVPIGNLALPTQTFKFGFQIR